MDASPQPSVLDYARDYLKRGWSILPIKARSKLPAVDWKQYQHGAPTVDRVEAWFAGTDLNVGIVAGSISGIFILDVDAAGHETLARLEAIHGPLPATIEAITPGSGRHIYFRYPGKAVITRAAVGTGLDVRGDGGMVVAPPSIHPNGGQYHWNVDHHPDEATIAPAPQWLLDMVLRGSAQQAQQPGEKPQAADGAFGIPEAGEIKDGREKYMRDTILAVLSDYVAKRQEWPTAHTLAELAWPQYRANVDLTRPGRGYDEFWTKTEYTLGRAMSGQIDGFKPPPPHRPKEDRKIDPETGEVLDDKPVLWVDAGDWDEATIPRRPWVAPGYLIRNAVAALSGQGSGGKSSLVVAWTIALATGIAIGEFRPVRAMTVLNYNVEDDELEQRRRYSAALKAVGKTTADIAGRVVRCGPNSIGTLFQRDAKTGEITPTAALDRLKALCVETQADVLICDPLAELHNAEENDNTAMRSVVAAFRQLAKELGIAVLVLHHDRKGNNAPGDMDRLRGASAITGAVRVLMTLTTMSDDEAGAMGVPTNLRRRHFRIDGAKSNYALAQEAEWWRLEGFELANGEEIAACLPWAPPSIFDGLSINDCVATLDAIAGQLPDGRPWGYDKRANDEWAGAILVGQGRTEKQAAAILAVWQEQGLITVGDGPSPRRGHLRKAVLAVDSVKVSEMRRQMAGK